MLVNQVDTLEKESRKISKMDEINKLVMDDLEKQTSELLLLDDEEMKTLA